MLRCETLMFLVHILLTERSSLIISFASDVLASSVAPGADGSSVGVAQMPTVTVIGRTASATNPPSRLGDPQ